MRRQMIAPCGMNCHLCMAYLRESEPCPGCRTKSPKPKTRSECKIKNCARMGKSGFCYDCKSFPCQRLGKLDARYRKKYSMSMIGNQIYIKKNGIARFLRKEGRRWEKDGKVFCVHAKRYVQARA
jgi:hypothetical protein